MVRTRRGLVYEEDLSQSEKEALQEEVKKYDRRHVGRKIIEASLTPSAQVGGNEANKNKILRFLYGKGMKISEVKDRGYARVELGFENYHEANACLSDSVIREAQREGIALEIPARAKICKGIVTGWDLGATLDELIDAMVVSSNVISLERMKRKVYEGEGRKPIEKVTHSILISWSGSNLPTEIRLYGGITSLRVRPYVDNVLQVPRLLSIRSPS